jgi:hypothetical protein
MEDGTRMVAEHGTDLRDDCRAFPCSPRLSGRTVLADGPYHLAPGLVQFGWHNGLVFKYSYGFRLNVSGSR